MLSEECRREAVKNPKTMIITFFDIKDTIHSEFIPQGQTVDQVYYAVVLKRLREDVCRKSHEI
jgi:hypothetical protein